MAETHPLRRAWAIPAVRDRLCSVFLKGIFSANRGLGRAFIETIDGICATPGQDDQIYSKLHRLLNQPAKDPFSRTFGNDEDERIRRRVQQLIAFIGNDFRPECFLDIGCGDGRVTAGLAKHWKLPPTKAIGVDVFNRVVDIKSITYIPVRDGRIELPDAHADFAIMLMVLHHEADPEKTLREAHRVLRSDGRLMIRDTDADTPDLKLFNHVMEDFYFQVFRDLPGVPNPFRHESATYWESLFTKVGFHIAKTERPEPGNPFTPVHWLLVKEKHHDAKS